MEVLYAQLDLSGAEASIKDIVWDPLPQPESFLTDFAAFLCTTRQCACRYGPVGWPLSGVGGWVWAKTPIHAVVLELSVLRECGLHEFGQLEKVLEHRRFRTWRPLCVRLGPQSAMWVLFGHLVLPASVDDFGHFVVIPWMSSGLAEGASEELWNFVSGSILAFGKKHEARAPWKRLVPAFRGFSQSLFKVS